MLADHDGLGISARSTNVGLAREFLQVIAGRQFQSSAEYINDAGFPSRSDVEFPTGVDPLRLELHAAIEELGSSSQMTVAVPYHARIGPLLASMLAGELEPEQVAAELEAIVLTMRSPG
jgi:ABC-type glycerol-3-phosphate transport system substrate-binding protein